MEHVEKLIIIDARKYSLHKIYVQQCYRCDFIAYFFSC